MIVNKNDSSFFHMHRSNVSEKNVYIDIGIKHKGRDPKKMLTCSKTWSEHKNRENDAIVGDLLSTTKL